LTPQYQGLPKSDGLLPYWFLLTSSLGVFNSAQNYYTSNLSRRLYGHSPESVTGLSNRLGAAWTFTSALIRFYAAYHSDNKAVYDLAIGTYLIAFFHFSTEFYVYRTLKMFPGGIYPIVVASLGLAWMWSQYDFYVGSPNLV
ncbi:Erg28-like protein, partial [Atractiella rhizophila]